MMNNLKIDLSLLSLYRTELMGFSAIGILMCHAYGNNVAMPSILNQICSLGQIGVPIFFLLSGMGMYYSLSKTKELSIGSWYRTRYIKLFVPYLLMAIPFYLWYNIYNGNGFIVFLIKITTLSYWIGGNGVWFVGAIIPLYFIVPWWHRLLNRTRYSWIPSLIVFVALICCGQLRHLSEVAFFFLGYWLGKPVSEKMQISAILWVILPVVMYVVSRAIPGMDCFPRFLLLVVPFMLFAAVVFNKVGRVINAPFLFMGKISLESYMANVMLPTVFALVPWMQNGVNYNVGNRLLYLYVIVFGVLIAHLVHKISQQIIGKLMSGISKHSK